jgi:UDPglucose--hexose-1-phosphate uridylyltransferase
MSLQRDSHSRRNLLTGEWVLVSPNRTERPWQGQVETTDIAREPEHDPYCYLCPGNQRANDITNPHYSGPFVFENDFAALSSTSEIESPKNSLFVVRPEPGRCSVVCYTHKHDQRLATMEIRDIEIAINAMTSEFVSLDRDRGVGYVQVFENRGKMMGCSNPHPHAQIWATAHLPDEPAKELAAQKSWWSEKKSPLLADYLHAEIDAGNRIVCDNKHFVALVPYWAVWPFETLILPRRSLSSFDEMHAPEVAGLANCLKSVLSAYEKLFDVPVPYSLGFHPRPSDGEAHPEWLFHAHIYPPLLRSAAIRKHLVGFEMLAMPQRDLTPEAAAERLRGTRQ